LIHFSGLGDVVIAATVAVGGSTVCHTKRCSVEMGLEASLCEEPRPGAERKLTGKEAALLATACSNPPPGCTRWTLELLTDARRAADDFAHCIRVDRSGSVVPWSEFSPC